MYYGHLQNLQNLNLSKTKRAAPEKSQVRLWVKMSNLLAEPYFEHTNCNIRDYTRIYNHCADVVQI